MNWPQTFENGLYWKEKPTTDCSGSKKKSSLRKAVNCKSRKIGSVTIVYLLLRVNERLPITATFLRFFGEIRHKRSMLNVVQ
jgi:hypothetical protein